jgi:hypothetical protein
MVKIAWIDPNTTGGKVETRSNGKALPPGASEKRCITLPP